MRYRVIDNFLQLQAKRNRDEGLREALMALRRGSGDSVEGEVGGGDTVCRRGALVLSLRTEGMIDTFAAPPQTPPPFLTCCPRFAYMAYRAIKQLNLVFAVSGSSGVSHKVDNLCIKQIKRLGS